MGRDMTCCFTGHRQLPAAYLDAIEKWIETQLRRAVCDGYTHFLCGMASGADMLFAKAVVALKAERHITLEAALPCPERLNTPDRMFRELILHCDRVTTHAPAYHPGCYHLRNQYMVDSSSRMIVVYNGMGRGGTAATLRYAQKQMLEVTILPVEA